MKAFLTVFCVLFLLGVITEAAVTGHQNTPTADSVAVTAGDQDQTEKEKEKKKDKEKKEEEKKTKKKIVITNEDLKDIKNVNITYMEPDSIAKNKGKPAAGSKKTAAKTGADDKRKNKEYWQGRMKSIKDNIEKTKNGLKAAELELPLLRRQHYNEDIYSRKVELKNKIDQTINKIRNYTRGLKNLEKAMEDLEDEARRAGVPPGWLR